jgi:hypothetical protein
MALEQGEELTGKKHHAQALPEDLTVDHSSWTVQQLKEYCQRGLPVSDVPIVLLERVKTGVHKRIAEMEKENRVNGQAQGFFGAAVSQSEKYRWKQMVPDQIARHLKDLVLEYVRARGGQATSRDIGRSWLPTNSLIISVTSTP